MDKKALLDSVGVSETQLLQTGASWDALFAIEQDYTALRSRLMTYGNEIAAHLQPMPAVHALRVEAATVERVLSDAVRAGLVAGGAALTSMSYTTGVPDLLRIRILTLFKEDWRPIHRFITETWNVKAPATAFVGSVPGSPFAMATRQAGCSVVEQAGSVDTLQYLVESNLFAKPMTATLLVRTVFDDAADAVARAVRALGGAGTPVDAYYLELLRRVLNKSQDLSTYVCEVHQKLSVKGSESVLRIRSLHDAVKALETSAGKMSLQGPDKAALKRAVDAVKNFAFVQPDLAAVFTDQQFLVEGEPITGFARSSDAASGQSGDAKASTMAINDTVSASRSKTGKTDEPGDIDATHLFEVNLTGGGAGISGQPGKPSLAQEVSVKVNDPEATQVAVGLGDQGDDISSTVLIDTARFKVNAQGVIERSKDGPAKR